MKVALYCRLSEEDRNKQFETDDSESIQNQKVMLTQYADTHGWEVYDIYSDDYVIIGISLKKPIKPMFFSNLIFSIFPRRVKSSV